jgi:hypothetical protein
LKRHSALPKSPRNLSRMASSSSLCYLVLKNKNVFVRKTTLRRSIQMAPAFLVARAPNPKGQLMASCLVNWLRQ